MIEKTLFDQFNGQDVFLYRLCNPDVEVGITDFGAAIQSLSLHTQRGWIDVCLGYPTIRQRLDSGTYCGATIGRVANRIGGAAFRLNGKRYRLSANEGKNCNHGGEEGFDKRFFQAEMRGDILRLSLLSEDGDQGFPGRFLFSVEFSLQGKSLQIVYCGESDCDTLWSPTCHAYFNLNGEGRGNILGHVLTIRSDKVTPVDGELLPAGTIDDVADTPFDFRLPKAIGAGLSAADKQLILANGYDHNYLLSGEHAASVFSGQSGIRMDLYTDLPGLQFYSGNGLNGRGKSGAYGPRDGFCLEPQYIPDAVNHTRFPSPVLEANRARKYYIRYEFCTDDPILRSEEEVLREERSPTSKITYTDF